MSVRPTAEPVEPLPLEIGDRIWFGLEPRRPYTVRAFSDHFVVCTRQADFQPKGVLVYTVIDWRNGIRGPINAIGQSWNVATDEECRELCDLLENGEFEVSWRNWVRLEIFDPAKRADE